MAKTDEGMSDEMTMSSSASSPAEMAQQKVREAMAQTQSVNMNMDSALWQTAQDKNLGEVKTDEVRFDMDGTTYIAQGFSDGIVYVVDGDWGNVQQVSA